MGRPSKLTPAQWAEIDRRLTEGEGVRALASAFGVSPATISKRGVSKQSKQVAAVAKQVAEAQTALAELPVAQQYNALSLADKLRSISSSLASAAELGAKTSHRLQALANSEVSKVDDADPMASLEALKGVSALTRLANDSSHIALNLLAANKERMKQAEEPEDEADKPRGVLVVPGMLQDTAAWSEAAQKASFKGGE